MSPLLLHPIGQSRPHGQPHLSKGWGNPSSQMRQSGEAKDLSFRRGREIDGVTFVNNLDSQTFYFEYKNLNFKSE